MTASHNIPWGGNNQMPFDIIEHIEKDETLATCQIFNAEVCYGSGLRHYTCIAIYINQAIADILKSIDEGKTQLPDFQRGWVWED